jgi:hypothetical protein
MLKLTEREPLTQPEDPAKPRALEAKAIPGVSELCPKCRGQFNKQRHCQYCDYRGVVVKCESCDGTGLIPASNAVYNVLRCLPCGERGFRPARFNQMRGTVIPNKFCRHCGIQGQHMLTPMGSVCAACNQNSMG